MQIWKYFFLNGPWHFNIYEQDKFCAQLSWAWKKFYNLGPSNPNIFSLVSSLHTSYENIVDPDQLARSTGF